LAATRAGGGTTDRVSVGVGRESRALRRHRASLRAPSKLGSLYITITQCVSPIAVFSPRFQVRKSDIRQVVNVHRLARLWKKRVRPKIKEQFIVDPIEHLDFQIDLKNRCSQLEERVTAGQYAPSSAHRILIEKSKGLCRQVLIINVEDALVLQCLSDSFFKDLNKNAPSSNAYYEPDRQIFSKNDIFSAPRYGSFHAWLQFQQRLFAFSKERNYLVITDIANFYDFISYDHLRNIISSSAHIREPILDMLIFILSGLLWQPDYTPRINVGLPQIDLDAPRVLAHAFLYELDNICTEKAHIDYARFMDDINIGVNSIGEAKSILRDIDLTLQTRQVRLNPGKTKILSRNEAVNYFHLPANSFLSSLQKRIQERIAKEMEIEREKTFIRRALVHRYWRRRFDEGYGEKVLKRALSACERLHVDIPANVLSDIIMRRPSCRQKAIKVLFMQGIFNENLEVLEQIFLKREIVDNATFVEMACGIVEGPASSEVVQPKVEQIIEHIPQGDIFTFFARVWILSKFARPHSLINVVRRTTFWRSDVVAGRLIGGLAPRLFKDDLAEEFDRTVSGSGNEGAIDVLNFHKKISTDEVEYRKIQKFLKTANKTKPLYITHPKALMLCSALQNTKIKVGEKKLLLQEHRRAMNDVYYRKAFFESIAPQEHLWEMKDLFSN